MPLDRRFAARLLVALAVVLALGAYAFVHAGEFLAAPGSEPRKADAVFVLGGDGGDRGLRAASLNREIVAPVYVLTGVEDAIEEVRLEILHWRARILVRRGVPETALEFDVDSSNSDEEAAYGLALARKRGWKRVLVVSDPPHMRRLSIIWGRTFAGSGIEVLYVPSRPKWWVPERWWTSRKSAQFVVTEYIKLVYTLL